MKRVWLYPLLALALALSGYGAFTLGRALRPEPPLAGTALQNPVAVGDVALRGSDGQGVALSSFAGNYLLVFFGYTRCPDVCSLVMADLTLAVARLPDEIRDDVQVAFVTSDPARDTPAALRAYLDRFDQDFVGFTGELETIVETAGTMGWRSSRAPGCRAAATRWHTAPSWSATSTTRASWCGPRAWRSTT